jgi:hypothetical protein
MTAAETMIRFLNTDDALTRRLTVCDGVDLETVTEIISDQEVDGSTDFLHYSRAEKHVIRARTSDGQLHTFYFAAEGSPDGVWAHMGKDRNDPRFLGVWG